MKALVKHHKVDVLVLRRGEQAYVERAGSARILRVPVPDGEILGRVEAFRRALRRQLEGADYDIVHVSDGWSGQTVLELQSQLKYAVVYDAGRSPLTGPLPLGVSVVSELQRAEAECATRADLVLAPTEPARQLLSGSLNSNRVHLVAPGVDVDLFDWDVPPTKGPSQILYVGTLSQGRGIQVLLGAMLELVRRTDAELVLVGRSGREFRQNLTATLRELDLGSRVTLRGVLDHSRVPELIAQATICVAPAAPDTANNRLALYPTKILEYLACQRLVVAPRRNSVSLLLRHEQTGLLFEPGQPTDLADTLERAMKDHDLRVRVARAGYDLVRQAHSASSTRRALIRAYNWLASQEPWRERFVKSAVQSAAVDVRVAELRVPGPQDTQATGWITNDDDAKVNAFDSNQFLLDEPTGVGSHETSINDPVGEVTRVELSPLLDSGDTRSTSLYPIDQEKVDDWVVEDSNMRPVVVAKSAVVTTDELKEGGDDDGSGGVRSSMDSSFVAGEIKSEDTAEVSLGDDRFIAVSVLLGSIVEEEKTRLFEVPSERLDGRRLDRKTLEQRMQSQQAADNPDNRTIIVSQQSEDQEATPLRTRKARARRADQDVAKITNEQHGPASLGAADGETTNPNLGPPERPPPLPPSAKPPPIPASDSRRSNLAANRHKAAFARTEGTHPGPGSDSS